ncbi:MAG: GTP-binding protein, partial [Oscillospiraceae bacterium]|nr:GTP-binding protein [Oscillospiraceae bacterium]
MVRNNLRNIAIIAHVDHGKTTLVDEMLKQSGAFRENQNVADRVMDSNAIERERGITILAKNTSIMYNDVKINIVDTPGHADFSGEVERVLNMVDGVLLLVDAAEGPMPQTRFVLSKALEMRQKIIVVVNKIDRPDARLDEIGDEVLELLLDLDANEEQLESPVLFCSGRAGTASLSQYEAGENLKPLFDTILDYIDPPTGNETGPLQMLVSSIDYNEYVGRIGIGRILRGTATVGQQVQVGNFHSDEKPKSAKLVTLLQIEQLQRVSTQTATVGDIVWVSGIEDINIGDTICAAGSYDPVDFTKISEPTVEMTFSVNDSPFAGQEGKFVTSRQVRDRLYRELLRDVSLRVTDTESTDSFTVAGRGEMHLSILIE